MRRAVSLVVSLALAVAVRGKVGIRRHRSLPPAPVDRGLLIMGSVGRKSARFVAEAPPSTQAQAVYRMQVDELHMNVTIAPAGSSHGAEASRTIHAETVRTLSVALFARPRAIELTNLKEATHYKVCLSPEGGKWVRGCVRFRTRDDGFTGMAATEAAGRRRGRFTGIDQHRVYVVSCDRWSEDGDDAVWSALLAREDLGPESPADPWLRRQPAGSLVDRMPDGSADATSSAASASFAHLGDQVYNDEAAASLLADPRRRTMTEMVEVFRRYYRAAWTRPTMERVLRFGAHYFLPDDHDVFNNVRGDLRSHGLSAKAVIGAAIPGVKVRHTFAGSNDVRDVILAAYAAYVEYQYQASGDVPALAGGPPRTLAVDLAASGPVTDPMAGATPASLDAHLVTSVEAADLDTRKPLSGLAPASRWGLPQDATHTFRAGATAFLMLDTRLHRTFSGHPEDGSHHIVTPSSLGRVFAALRGLEADASVKEVVVLSSIPLVWMDEATALLADLYETDRYTAHPTELPGSIALLEVLAASSKTRLLVGGDVHVQAQASACRQPVSSGAGPNSDRMRRAHREAVAMLQQAGAWPAAPSRSDTDQEAAYRVAVAMGNTSPRQSERRCFTQLVTSGLSWGSAALSEEVIAVYNAMLRWGSRVRIGPFNGRIHDVHLSNNYVRLDTGVRAQAAEWWRPAAVPVSYNRWAAIDGIHQPLACGRVAPFAAGRPILDFESEPPVDVHGLTHDKREQALQRRLRRARALDAASPTAFREVDGSLGAMGCECGAVPGSSVAYTACRRWVTGENSVVQDALDAAEPVFLSPERGFLALGLLTNAVATVLAAVFCCCNRRSAQLG